VLLPKWFAASPDGRWLAAVVVRRPAGVARPAAAAVEITIWDVAAKRELRRLPVAPEVSPASLAFNPDGSTLAAVGRIDAVPGPKPSGFVAAWDVNTGKEKFLRKDIAGRVQSLSHSPDGRLLATGGECVYLWEVATGRDRQRFLGHAGLVSEVAFSPDGKLLAAASPDAPALVWDVEGRYGQPLSAAPFAAAEAELLWDALADPSAPAGFDAMRRLLARPGPGVALLGERLRPAPAVREGDVQRLLRDLDAAAFAVREKATAELEAAADRAEPILRKALADQPSVEAKRQIERALQSAGPDAPARRREARAVEVLERLGTKEARDVLAALAGGAEGAFLTREARLAVGRLARR
jgi:dipeptidyl aminopeptidase/acylaminoacyl peptidase